MPQILSSLAHLSDSKGLSPDLAEALRSLLPEEEDLVALRVRAWSSFIWLSFSKVALSP